MKEEKSVQWLNVDVPSVLSGVPEEKKPRLPVIFETAGESVWGPGLLAQIQARGRELRGKEREPQVEEYFLHKGYTYPELNEERMKKLTEEMFKISSNYVFVNNTPRELNFDVRTSTKEEESDAEELSTMIDNCEFSLGDRVKDNGDWNNYATVIGIKPDEVLLEYADLSGQCWRLVNDVDALYGKEEYFEDYNDWKLRGIDKTLE